MAVTVKKAVLWRKEIDNRPGMLANILGPLSEAGTDLQVVMAYRYPGRTDTAAIELHPVSGRKPIAAAKAAGLAQSPIPILLVEGDNRQGLGLLLYWNHWRHLCAMLIGYARVSTDDQDTAAQVVALKAAKCEHYVYNPCLSGRERPHELLRRRPPPAGVVPIETAGRPQHDILGIATRGAELEFPEGCINILELLGRAVMVLRP
jgi:hypothetical protein